MPRAVVLLEAPRADQENFLKNLRLQCDKPKPSSLKDDEVLVELTCRPVNPADVMCVKGAYSDFHPEQFPATPGLEGVGRVADVGAQFGSIGRGERVMPMLTEYAYRGEGSWEDFVVVKVDDVVKVPEGVPDDMAAQGFVNPSTVIGLFDTLQVPEGEYLLMSAANSALGKEMVAFAKSVRVKTICLVRRDSAKGEMENLGADLVLNPVVEKDVRHRVMEMTKGKGAYAAVDPVCGELTKLMAQCTREHGTVLVYGNMCGGDLLLSPMDLIFRDVKLQGFNLTRWIKEKYPSVASRHELAEKIFQLFKDGVFQPRVGKKFELQDFEEAIMESMREGKEGKVMLIS